MKQPAFSSFRRRLNGAFLAASLIPLLLCSVLLLQTFRLRMRSSEEQTAQQQLTAAENALDLLQDGFTKTVEALQQNQLVTQALFDDSAEDSKVYNQLFQATEALRSFASFHL